MLFNHLQINTNDEILLNGSIQYKKSVNKKTSFSCLIITQEGEYFGLNQKVKIGF